jgi:hypothetical protein
MREMQKIRLLFSKRKKCMFKINPELDEWKFFYEMHTPVSKESILRFNIQKISISSNLQQQLL